MTVQVTYNAYSECCGNYNYGRQHLDLPDDIIDAIDDYFDGGEIEAFGSGNPDDVYINSYMPLSLKEVLVSETALLSKEAYSALLESDSLEDYILEHQEEIESSLNDSYHVLGYVNKTYHVFM